MESIESTINRVFPAEIQQAKEVTMQQLGEMKTELKKSLPNDAQIELTMLMNSIVLAVYYKGEWHRRACQVKS